MMEKLKVKAVIDRTIKKIDCENHYDDSVFECGYYFSSDEKYVEYYTYTITTEDKKIAKFNSFNKYIRKGDIVIGDAEEIEDNYFGKIIYIDNAKVKADDEKRYVRFIKENFEEIDGDVVNKIYNKYHAATLDALESLDVLLQYNIKEKDIYKIIKRAKILNETNYFFTTLNICAGIRPSFKAISRMIMDGVTNAELENNPYVIMKYAENTNYIKQLDKYFLVTNSVSRTTYLIYLFLLNEYRKKGNICYDLGNIKVIMDYINDINNVKVTVEDIAGAIKSNEFVIYNNYIYLYKNYFNEKDICNKVIERMNDKADDKKANVGYLSNEQNIALNNVLNNKLSLVNGGPGTGKSYLISNIIKYINENEKDKKILVVSLTGRVVNKLKNSIEENDNVRFLTIHSALHLNIFQKNNVLNDIEDDYVFVDECSMIDINLFKYLFNHINKNSHIALFGDYNQIQAIGAGNVFYDLCKAGNIAKITLTKTFRVIGDNSIIPNAHYVLNGLGTDKLKKDNNFYIVGDLNERYINEIAVDCIDCFQKQRNFKIEDIMVLTATRERARKINNLIQRKFNKTNEVTLIKGKTFKLHDKVMCVKNDKETGVMNGDVGYITRVDSDYNFVTVSYPHNNIVIYDASNIDKLELAYAMTIHKAQGSEAKNVFVVVGEDEEKFLNRNMIYTAITRAKSNVIIVGNNEVVDNAIIKVEDKSISNITHRINEG